MACLVCTEYGYERNVSTRRSAFVYTVKMSNVTYVQMEKKNSNERAKHKPVQSQKNIDCAAKKKKKKSIIDNRSRTSNVKKAQTDVCTDATQGSARSRHSSIPDNSE